MTRSKAKPEEDDEVVVICFKVLVMPRPYVPGCSRVPCSDCGQPVWLSPATAAHVADKPHRICCAECVAKLDDPDTQVMAPTPGQIAEMTAADPSLTPARIRRKFPASNPSKRKAAFDEMIRRTRAKKRTDN
jgi:hypothetical protein